MQMSKNVMRQLKWRQWSSHDSSSVKENGEVNVTVSSFPVLNDSSQPTCRAIIKSDAWKKDIFCILSEFDSSIDNHSSCSRYSALWTAGVFALHYVNFQYVSKINQHLYLWSDFQRLWQFTYILASNIQYDQQHSCIHLKRHPQNQCTCTAVCFSGWNTGSKIVCFIWMQLFEVWRSE